MDAESASLPMILSMRVNSEKESSMGMERCHGVMVDGMRASGGMARCKGMARKSVLMEACATKERGQRVSH